MLHRREELTIWISYFDGQETYKIRTELSPELIFSGTQLRELVAYAAEDMMFKLETELFDRA